MKSIEVGDTVECITNGFYGSKESMRDYKVYKGERYRVTNIHTNTSTTITIESKVPYIVEEFLFKVVDTEIQYEIY